MTTRSMRDKVAVLQRRRDWLVRRIEKFAPVGSQDSKHWMQAEVGALEWAIGLMQAALDKRLAEHQDVRHDTQEGADRGKEADS